MQERDYRGRKHGRERLYGEVTWKTDTIGASNVEERDYRGK